MNWIGSLREREESIINLKVFGLVGGVITKTGKTWGEAGCWGQDKSTVLDMEV